MNKNLFLSATVFTLLVVYLLAGFITQSIMGAAQWTDSTFALGASFFVAAIPSLAVFFVLNKYFPISPGASRKAPPWLVKVAAACVLITVGFGSFMGHSRVLEDRQTAADKTAADAAVKEAAHKRVEAEQKRLAAMTPQQRAAETESKALHAKVIAEQAKVIAEQAAQKQAEIKKKKDDENNRAMMTLMAFNTIKNNLRDPKSAEWDSIRANDNGSVVCLILRARNGFGGMNLEQYTILNGKIKQSSYAWNKHCTGELWNMKYWVNLDRD